MATGIGRRGAVDAGRAGGGDMAPVLAVDTDTTPTEARYAELFTATYADRLRYLHARGCWYEFQGHAWRPDRDGGIVRHALGFVRLQQQAALQIVGDRAAKQAAARFAISAESKAFLERLIGLAKNLKPLADAGDDWDADPWLLGVPNGVVDLRTGELRDGRPEDRITQQTAVPYIADAECPRWERFLAEIFDNDVELVEFIQAFAGYSLTGDTREQCLILGYGSGANGKTTLLNTLSYVLGDYAHVMPFTTIERQRSTIPNDVAALAGKRFVTAAETTEGARLNEARVKALVGCDPVSARFLHGEWFTFRPCAKFWLAVNHRPSVGDDSPGFWRRIRLLPFARAFTGADRDDTLEAKLRAEGPGILRWAVEGCLRWQRDGLPAPAAVLHATEEYRQDADMLADFLAEACVIEPGASARAADLQEAYARWADRARLSRSDRLNARELSRRLADRFTKRKTMTGWVYDGLRVASEKLW